MRPLWAALDDATRGLYEVSFHWARRRTLADNEAMDDLARRCLRACREGLCPEEGRTEGRRHGRRRRQDGDRRPRTADPDRD